MSHWRLVLLLGFLHLLPSPGWILFSQARSSAIYIMYVSPPCVEDPRQRRQTSKVRRIPRSRHNVRTECHFLCREPKGGAERRRSTSSGSSFTKGLVDQGEIMRSEAGENEKRCSTCGQCLRFLSVRMSDPLTAGSPLADYTESVLTLSDDRICRPWMDSTHHQDRGSGSARSTFDGSRGALQIIAHPSKLSLSCAWFTQ